MKLIVRAAGRAQQGGPDQYCNNLKHNRTTITAQVLKINSKCIVILTYFDIRGIVKVTS